MPSRIGPRPKDSTGWVHAFSVPSRPSAVPPVGGLPYHQCITEFTEHWTLSLLHSPLHAFMSTVLFPCSYTYRYGYNRLPFKLNRLPPRTVTVRAAVSAPEKRGRRKKPAKGDGGDDYSALENGLRFTFMEELMDRARNRDTAGVSGIIYDMVAAGLTPGPRSFHALVVSHSLNGNEQAAVPLSLCFFLLSLRNVGFVLRFGIRGIALFRNCRWTR